MIREGVHNSCSLMPITCCLVLNTRPLREPFLWTMRRRLVWKEAFWECSKPRYVHLLDVKKEEGKTCINTIPVDYQGGHCMGPDTLSLSHFLSFTLTNAESSEDMYICRGYPPILWCMSRNIASYAGGSSCPLSPPLFLLNEQQWRIPSGCEFDPCWWNIFSMKIYLPICFVWFISV